MSRARGLISGDNGSGGYESRASGMYDSHDNVRLRSALSNTMKRIGRETEVWNTSGNGLSSFNKIKFSPNGMHVYAVYSGDYVKHWTLTKPFDLSTATAQTTWTTVSHESAAISIDFSPDGRYLYLAGTDRDTINQYTLSTNWYLNPTPNMGYEQINNRLDNPMTLPSEDDSLTRSIEFNDDGTKLYTIGYGSDRINQYTLSTAWLVGTATLDGAYDVGDDGITVPESIRWNNDGTKFFVVDRAGYNQQKVVEYSVSNAYDVTSGTITEGTNYSISSQETSPGDVAFNSDGTRMYVVGFSGVDITEYSLSTGFDLSSTVAHLGQYSVGTSQPTNFSFSPDGTKLVVLDMYNDTLYHYTLSTGFDLSTLSGNGTTDLSPATVLSGVQGGGANGGNQFTTPMGVRFGNNGYMMYVYEGYSTSVDKIVGFNLGTPYDSSTIIDGYVPKTDTSHDNPSGIKMKPDGTKVYIFDATDKKIHQWSLDVPFACGSGVMTYDGESSLLDGHDLYPIDFDVTPDGKELYVSGLNADVIMHYRLSTPWDFTSTISFIDSIDISLFELNPRSLQFCITPEGYKLFFGGEELWSLQINF